MSKKMFEGFFPAVVKYFNLNQIWFYKVAFPESAAQICPEVQAQVKIPFPTLKSSSTTIRNPALLVCALVGVWIGLFGGIRNHQMLKKNNTYRENTTTRLYDQYNCEKYKYYVWACAFGAFGFMNVTAIFIHCLWPFLEDNDTYIQRYPIFWVLDTYMTGLSSTCLGFAALEHLVTSRTSGSRTTTTPTTTTTMRKNDNVNHQQQDQKRQQQQQIWRLFVAVQWIGIACIGWFFLTGNNNITSQSFFAPPSSSFPLELWYLVPTFLAGIPLSLVMYQNILTHLVAGILDHHGKHSLSSLTTVWTTSPSWNTVQCALASCAACVLVGFAIDAIWCHWFGQILGDVITVGTFTFLGCNLGFWSIQKWIDDNYNDEENYPNKSYYDRSNQRLTNTHED